MSKITQKRLFNQPLVSIFADGRRNKIGHTIAGLAIEDGFVAIDPQKSFLQGETRRAGLLAALGFTDEAIASRSPTRMSTANAASLVKESILEMGVFSRNALARHFIMQEVFDVSPCSSFGLTDRQREILSELSYGATVGSMARALTVSRSSVGSRLASLDSRMGELRTPAARVFAALVSGEILDMPPRLAPNAGDPFRLI